MKKRLLHSKTTAVSTKETKTVLLTLSKRECFCSVVLQLVKNAATRQIEHNQEMEKKFAKDQNYRDATMQQQFWHGAQFVLDTVKAFEEMNEKPTAVFVAPWEGTAYKGCKLSPKLKKAFQVFKTPLQ